MTQAWARLRMGFRLNQMAHLVLFLIWLGSMAMFLLGVNAFDRSKGGYLLLFLPLYPFIAIFGMWMDGKAAKGQGGQD